MQDVAGGLRDQICAVRADVSAQSKQIEKVGGQVQELEQGLDERIRRTVLAEITPPATPRHHENRARDTTPPPGLGGATGTRKGGGSESETPVWRQLRDQKTVVVWGWDHNTHKTALLADLEKILAEVGQEDIGQTHVVRKSAPFVRGSKVQILMDGENSAWRFREGLSAWLSRTGTRPNLRVGMERSQVQRHRSN
eukprot:2506306-Amphidinium_carterae.1